MKSLCGQDAKSEIKSFYSTVLHLENKKFLDAVAAVSEIRIYEKNEYYIKEGEEEPFLSFLGEGILSNIENSGIGRRGIKEIYSDPGSPLFTKIKLRHITPADFSMQWLTDGKAYCFPLKQLPAIEKQYPLEILKLKGELLETAVTFHVQHRYITENLSAQDRYQWLKEHFPEYLERISHVAVAEMLNMTPETLSRIRRRCGDIDG